MALEPAPLVPGRHGPPVPEISTRSVTAQLRYGATPPEATMEVNYQKWTDLHWLYNSKRRFQAVDYAAFIHAVTIAIDNRGAPRYALHYDRGEERWWIHCPTSNDRRETRRSHHQ